MPQHSPDSAQSPCEARLLDDVLCTAFECSHANAHEFVRLVALARELQRGLHLGEVRPKLIALIEDVAINAEENAQRFILLLRELQQTAELEARWKELQTRAVDGAQLVLTGTSIH
jgi:serine phosphatase RsbU (regulator of sigma subunit)